MKWLLLPLLLLSTSIVAMGQDDERTKLDGNGLLPKCQAYVDFKNNPSPASASFCLGVVYGVSYFQEVIGAVCSTQGVNVGQQVRVVVKYLNDHPAELNEDGALLVSQALRQAWPCPQKK